MFRANVLPLTLTLVSFASALAADATGGAAPDPAQGEARAVTEAFLDAIAGYRVAGR